ncbi:MAG: hypothetical protein ABII00_05790 [Elusimicrobiota bacterium]
MNRTNALIPSRRNGDGRSPRAATAAAVAVASFSAAAALLLAALAAPPPARAAVAQRINFQGRLLDPATKNPRTETSADITFRVCDSLAGACTGGSLLWAETQTVNLSNGVFDVILGDVVAITSSVFSGSAQYLELVVEGETMSPRQRMVSVPMALRAAVAESVAAGDPNYVQVRQTLQAGATFYVSSGTVSGDLLAGNLRVTGLLRAGAAANQLTTASGLLNAASVDGATLVPNASVDASSVTKQGNAFNAANRLLRLGGTGLIDSSLVDASSVTKQGNSVNGPNGLMRLDGSGNVPSAQIDGSSIAKLSASGLVPSSLIDSSSVTKQGNSVNGPNGLLRLDGSGLVPSAQINGSSITKLNASGLVPSSLIDASSVTKQGNVFNAANRLVRLDASGTLNATATGAAVYSISASSSVNVSGTGKLREGGNPIMPAGAIFLWLGAACPAGFTEVTSLRGRMPLGAPAGGTVGITGGAAAFTGDGGALSHVHAPTGALASPGFRSGGSLNLTDNVDTTMPYVQVLFCRKS